jgi:hypothetical protein
MQNGESRGQNESQAQDQHHRGQSAIRHGLTATLSGVNYFSPTID